jgi:hypothetical protein
MVTRVIRNDGDLALLVQYLKARKRPYTVDIVNGKHRTNEQNHLQRLWLKEAAEQLGDRTAEELRGECKLTFGVPILRHENEAFREKYDAMVKPLPYPMKLALMMEPFDMAVTRIMTTDQKTRFLEQMQRHFLEQGVALTEPKSKRDRADVPQQEAA